MEEGRNLKRPFAGDVCDDRSPLHKKPMFPKGKKSKAKGYAGFADGFERISNGQINPDVATKERAKRRIEKREEYLLGSTADVSVSEVHYEENSNFEIDGIEIEPFNLKQEQEEGYFDENGNYVEYRHEQEIQDAWLDTVSTESRFEGKILDRKIAAEEYEDLSLEEMRMMKRRIIDILHPRETIIQALKRLKGTSTDRKAKMSEGTKLLFDQLTEDAMKLMESGQYNVYHEEREIFERETASKDDDKFDMFGDADDADVVANGNLNLDEDTLGTTSGQTTHSVTEGQEASEYRDSTEVAVGGSESDYAYDPLSGYYYSDTLGYYYDPTSMLYCCAATGIWYSFDEQLGTYTEVKSASTEEM